MTIELHEKKILVTGGTGYIGTKLCRALLEKGALVYVLTRSSETNTLRPEIQTIQYSTENIPDIADEISGIGFDIIYHLAAKIGATHDFGDLPDYTNVNLLLGLTLLESLRNRDAVFINTGTYWQHKTGTATEKPLNLYAATKSAFQSLISYYASTYEIKAASLKLYDVYGPNDPRPKLLNLILLNKSFSVSSGEQYIDLVHVDDVISAFLAALDAASTAHPEFCATTGKPIKLLEVFHFFNNHGSGQFNLGIGEKQMNTESVMKPYCGKTLSGWQPKHSLFDDLEDFISSNSTEN